MLKFFRRVKKSYKLYRFSKKLSRNINWNNAQADLEDSKTTLEEFIKFCKQDIVIHHILAKHNIDDLAIREIISTLELNGAAENIGGYYVPARAIFDPAALCFLLSHYDGMEFSVNDWDNRNSTLFIVNILLQYSKKIDPDLLKKMPSKADNRNLWLQTNKSEREFIAKTRIDDVAQRAKRWKRDQYGSQGDVSANTHKTE
jgi:hypothetical protein